VAAQKICEALRAAGIEVWFDQSELRDQSLLNANTARGWTAACVRILEDVADTDDTRKIDVPTAIKRYHNKHPGDLKGNSLLFGNLAQLKSSSLFRSYREFCERAGERSMSQSDLPPRCSGAATSGNTVKPAACTTESHFGKQRIGRIARISERCPGKKITAGDGTAGYLQNFKEKIARHGRAVTSHHRSGSALSSGRPFSMPVDPLRPVAKGRLSAERERRWGPVGKRQPRPRKNSIAPS
jgi:hypothetical protein